jgi:transcriptional regulator with XRE-family HTH domain
MQIYFGENIKRLRRERDLTQEDLARFLGVSFQAVSKWERGETTPDIATLPGIARYFGVTTDALLGVDKLDEDERMNEYSAKYSENNRNGLTDENIALWRAAYEEFPNNFSAINMYLNSLYMWSVAHNDYDKYRDEIIALGTQFLDDCKDENLRLGVIQTLSFTYAAANDTEAALKYANLLPFMPVNRASLLSHILKGEDLRKLAQGQIITHLVQMQLSIFDCVFSREHKKEDFIHAYEITLKLYELVFDDGDFGPYNNYSWTLHISLAGLYADTQNAENTIEHCAKAIHYARDLDNLKPHSMRSFLLDGYEYTPEFGDEKTYIEKSEQSIKRTLATPEFDFLRDNPEFQALLQ